MKNLINLILAVITPVVCGCASPKPQPQPKQSTLPDLLPMIVQSWPETTVVDSFKNSDNKTTLRFRLTIDSRYKMDDADTLWRIGKLRSVNIKHSCEIRSVNKYRFEFQQGKKKYEPYDYENSSDTINTIQFRALTYFNGIGIYPTLIEDTTTGNVFCELAFLEYQLLTKDSLKTLTKKIMPVLKYAILRDTANKYNTCKLDYQYTGKDTITHKPEGRLYNQKVTLNLKHY